MRQDWTDEGNDLTPAGRVELLMEEYSHLFSAGRSRAFESEITKLAHVCANAELGRRREAENQRRAMAKQLEGIREVLSRAMVIFRPGESCLIRVNPADSAAIVCFLGASTSPAEGSGSGV